MADKQAEKIVGCTAMAVVAFLACLAIYILWGSQKSQPQAQLPLSDLTYDQVSALKNGMTDTQWEAYVKSNPQLVQWSGVIDNIKVDIGGSNNVWIDMDGDGWNDLVFEYPVQDSLRYSRGQRISFRGRLTGDTVLGGAIILEDAEILP